MQTISIYPGAILEVQTTLMQLKPQKIFLVTGKKSFSSCGAEEKLKWLKQEYNVVHFKDFETNPSSTDVEKGIQVFNEEQCDLIISVGGGSPIDMAKLINYYYTNGDVAITSKNTVNTAFKPIRHICIPTTAGSGSESTHFAVMYIGDEKYSIAHEKLIPDFAFIDPELHYSQTPYQKAVSGADALAQAIESFWSIQSTEESRIYSEKALELVWNYLPDVVNKGDKMAHLKLAIGANLAGRAINIAKTTAPHAFAYGFTKHAGLPHGHAVALTLPYFLNAHSHINEENCNDKRGFEYVEGIFVGISKIMNCKTSKLNDTLNKFFKSIGIETNFDILKINQDKIKQILSNFNQQRLANNPMKVNNPSKLILFFINEIQNS